MASDLIRLWAVRDAAHRAWRDFMEESQQYGPDDDPVLEAMNVPEASRSDKQQLLLQEVQDRRHRLLEAIWEAERNVRVATGHATPSDLRRMQHEQGS